MPIRMTASPLPQAPSAESVAAASSPLIDAALRHALDGVLTRLGLLMAVKDANSGRYLAANPGYAAWLGRTLSELIGSTDAELFDAGVVRALRAAEQSALSQAAALSAEHRFEWKGVRHDFSVQRSHQSVDGQTLLVSVWQDLAPQRQREAQLKAALEQIEREQRANDGLRRELADQGLRDSATGLYTRAHFDDQLRREVDLSTREHREFALVLAELDPYVDRVLAAGARGEERILEAMGRLLRGNTRAMDASCRIDDRCFAILLSGVGLATAHARMEGLRRQCATQIVALDGQELGFTLSMGIASFPHTAASQDEVQSAALHSLARARERGGNAVALASIRFGSGTAQT